MVSAKMKDFCINTSCRCGEDVLEILTNIQTAGFERVMISEGYGGNLETAVKHALAKGLKIPCVHLSWKKVNDLWEKGRNSRICMHELTQSVKLCGKNNIGVCVMHATNDDLITEALPNNKLILRRMKKLLKTAEKNNVKLALENLKAFSLPNFCYLLDQFSGLGFCFDIGHQNAWPCDLDLLEMYGSRCLVTHIHDNTGTLNQDEHLLPFDGKIDFETILKKLKAKGFDGVCVLEVKKYPNNIHAGTTPLDFLKEAKKRGERLQKFF